MRRLVFGLCLLLLAARPAGAEQAAWVTRQQADTAHAVLLDQKDIRHFCEPCGDICPTMETVETVAVNGDADNWEVRVNGKGIDMAYVYVQVKGTWVNLARLLDIRADDVSPILPANPMPMFSEEEYARLLKTSPEFQTADERLNNAWKVALLLVPKKEKEKFQDAQKDWLFERDGLLQRLMVRHKYHMGVPEGVLRGGSVDRERAFAYFADTRAALLEQYAKGLKGEATFTGVWSAEESELAGDDGRGLYLDDGLHFISICGAVADAGIPEQVRAVPTGLRVRVSGPMAGLDEMRCVKSIRLEKLDPLPKKEPEPGPESSAHASVVGILCALESDVEPFVDLGGGEYYSLSLRGDGARDCRENAEAGELVAVTGMLKTPARGLPFFDPTAPTTCTRLLRTN